MIEKYIKSLKTLSIILSCVLFLIYTLSYLHLWSNLHIKAWDDVGILIQEFYKNYIEVGVIEKLKYPFLKHDKHSLLPVRILQIISYEVSNTLNVYFIASLGYIAAIITPLVFLKLSGIGLKESFKAFLLLLILCVPFFRSGTLFAIVSYQPLSPLLVLLSLYYISKDKFYLGFIIGVLVSFIHGHGIVITITILPYLFYKKFILKENVDIKFFAIWISVSCILLYHHVMSAHGVSTASQANNIFTFKALSSIVLFLFKIIGSLFHHGIGSGPKSWVCPAAGVLILLVWFWQSFGVWFNSQNKEGFLFFFSFFILVSLALTSIFRYQFVLGSERFEYLATYFFAATIALVLKNSDLKKIFLLGIFLVCLLNYGQRMMFKDLRFRQGELKDNIFIQNYFFYKNPLFKNNKIPEDNVKYDYDEYLKKSLHDKVFELRDHNFDQIESRCKTDPTIEDTRSFVGAIEQISHDLFYIKRPKKTKIKTIILKNNKDCYSIKDFIQPNKIPKVVLWTKHINKGTYQISLESENSSYLYSKKLKVQ